MDLSKDVGVEYESNAVEDAYFIANKRKSNEKKVVVVKFSSKTEKDKLMSSKSKLKENDSTSKVYVNDFLSKETLNLLNYAKTLKSVGYEYVYVRSGRVFAKKSDITKQQLIRCEDDVDNMLLIATTNKKRRSVFDRKVTEVNVSSDDGEDGAAYVSPS